jgi:hypothetical protein
MLKRIFPFSLAVVVMAASAALAAGLTDRLQAQRMTVVRVDHAAGRFQCAEHGRWTSAVRKDLRDVHPGDIVKVEPAKGKPVRIVVVRTAADEIASPE